MCVSLWTDAISPLCQELLVIHPLIFVFESQVPFHYKITRSLLLAISICYHARLQDREDYEKGVTAEFMVPLRLPGGAAQFRNEVHWYLPTQHLSLSQNQVCRIFCLDMHLLTILPS